MMPGRNGTGPMGQGQVTGRGMGPCNGNRAYNGRGFGRGFGMGYGRGYYNAQPSKEELKLEKDDLQRRLDDINKELEK